MFKTILYLLLISFHFNVTSQDQISLISWNIRDFGKTKNNEELDQIAEIVRDADILAIQEVVAGYGGAPAVAKLADILNRKGSKWDYAVSQRTATKYVTERYAFIWKTKNIKIKNRGALIKELEELVDREPFYIDFYVNGQKLSIINFHSRPHDKDPESEIRAITDYLKNKISDHPIILAGDFNVNEKEPVFDHLKSLGFRTALTDQKTTLKKNCVTTDYLNHAIDNIFYNTQISKLKGDTIDFINACENLANARRLSDHLPVFLKFQVN